MASKMTKCKRCKDYAKTLPGRLCADCFWEEDRKFKYNLYLEARKVHRQGVGNNGENKNPPPQGEDGGLGVLSPERTNATLPPEGNARLQVEERCH